MVRDLDIVHRHERGCLDLVALRSQNQALAKSYLVELGCDVWGAKSAGAGDRHLVRGGTGRQDVCPCVLLGNRYLERAQSCAQCLAVNSWGGASSLTASDSASRMTCASGKNQPHGTGMINRAAHC